MYKAFTYTRGEATGLPIPPTFLGVPLRVRGNAVNDWVVAGLFNVLGHYNGFTFKHFAELMHTNGELLSIAQKNNLVIAVGYVYHPINSRGLVIRGRR